MSIDAEPAPRALYTVQEAPRMLYRVKDFCLRHSISNTTFWKLVKTGALQIVHVGSRALVPATSEAEWLASLKSDEHKRFKISDLPEYTSWRSMIQRCQSPNDAWFSHYGGRGIKVCNRWQEFEQFLSDMRLKPSPKHSIDRIDNDGDYEPDNCRWATAKEQAQNRRQRRFYRKPSTPDPTPDPAPGK